MFSEDNRTIDHIQETILKLTRRESINMVYMPQHGRIMPSVPVLGNLVDKLREVLFPGYFGNSSLNKNNFGYHIGVNVDHAFRLLSDQIFKGLCFSCKNEERTDFSDDELIAEEMATSLVKCLPEIRRMLSTDVIAACNGDPAANSHGEVIYSYPTIRAMTNHRIAHELYKLEVPLIPRIISEMAHSETGIDIHPGAQIGEFFAIDHDSSIYN